MKYVCTECFSDPILKKTISDESNSGDCDFCGSENVFRIYPYQLREHFEIFLQIYTPFMVGDNALPDQSPLDSGDTLADQIDYSWGIFSEKTVDLRDDIVYAIFTDGVEHDEIDGTFEASQMWVGYESNFWTVTPDNEWTQFVRRITTQYRFTFGSKLDSTLFDAGRTSPPEEWISELLENIAIELDQGTEIFALGSKMIRVNLPHSRQKIWELHLPVKRNQDGQMLSEYRCSMAPWTA